MKARLLATTILTSALYLSTTEGQLLPFLSPAKPPTHLRQQTPMDPASPNIQLPQPPQNPTPDQNKPTGSSSITLSDILGTSPEIQIFAGLARDITSISARLDSSLLNTTLLAPKNLAITSLPRKPWEDAREYAALGPSAYGGTDGEDRAHRNLRRFTEAHVVSVSPWEEGVKVETLGENGGRKIWWERRDGKVVVLPDGVEVESVASRVGNGEVWVLKQVLNYAS